MKVSVVVPVYQNAASLPFLHERLGHVATATRPHEYEFLFVDDGSSDGSYDTLALLAAQDSRVKALRLVRNFGSNAAILAGLVHASGDCVVVISADLQDPPELIPEMLNRWCEGNKVVLAARARREEPLMTRAFSGLFNRLFRKFVFPNFPPKGFDFFLADRQVIRVITRMTERNFYLMGLLLWPGFKTATLTYVRQKRVYGKSQWTSSKKIKYFIDAFVGFSYLPLRLASVVGMLIALFGFLYAGVVIVDKFISGFPVEGWASLMVVLLIVSGTQMVMLGILGEYLWRTLDQARRRPPFLIADSIGVAVLEDGVVPSTSNGQR